MSDDGTYRPREKWLTQSEKKKGPYYMDRHPMAPIPETEYEPPPEDVKAVDEMLRKAETDQSWYEWLWQRFLAHKQEKMERNKERWKQQDVHKDATKERLWWQRDPNAARATPRLRPDVPPEWHRQFPEKKFRDNPHEDEDY